MNSLKAPLYLKSRPEGSRPRVLVTGGCGFIGRHLAVRLVQRGCSVVVLDDLSTGIYDGLRTNPHVVFHLGSVMNPGDLQAVSSRFDMVFHLAGVVGKALAFERPVDAYRIAVDGTRNVLASVPDCPTVIFSSSAVYGVDVRGPVRESDDVREQHALDYDGGEPGYAVGKLRMEAIATEETRRGRPVLAVRPFNVIGPGQTGAYGMVVPRFLSHAMTGKPLLVYGDGSQRRSFSDVRTFVDTLLALIANDNVWRLERPVINIGAPRSTSILALAETTLSVTGSKSPIRFVPYESVFPGQRDVLERVPDTTLLESLVGGMHWPLVRTIVRSAHSALLSEPVRTPHPLVADEQFGSARGE